MPFVSFLTYLILRCIAFPLQFLPYSLLHHMGNGLGALVFHFYPKYRKRACSNLALASSLQLTPQQIPPLAKRAIQSKSITALEYPRLYREREVQKVVTCQNPEVAYELFQSGKGVIFFSGHQANWEIGFLEATQRMAGVAIGRPIKNSYLYRWVISIREKYGAHIIPPQGAYRHLLHYLKKGRFVGIVGDQGMPNSKFSSLFLGREAWTSPLPALLSKKSGAPIIVATTLREKGKYLVHYSSPIWPTGSVTEQMREVLGLFEASVAQRPHEWLWTHNRWKQQLPDRLKKCFRHDSIAFIFPNNLEMLSWLSQIRKYYPREQITLFIPFGLEPASLEFEIQFYHDIKEVLVIDYRFKMIVDFVHDKKIHKHFSRLSALQTHSFPHPREFLLHACK